MKLLLDTHAFMWWDSDISRTPPETLSRMQQPDTQLLVSIISLWEIQIKGNVSQP